MSRFSNTGSRHSVTAHNTALMDWEVDKEHIENLVNHSHRRMQECHTIIGSERQGRGQSGSVQYDINVTAARKYSRTIHHVHSLTFPPFIYFYGFDVFNVFV